MGLTKVNQENEGSSIASAPKKGSKSFGKSTPSQQKSLIPVPKASLSPKNGENASPAVGLGQKSRRPLAPMQQESPQVRKSSGKVPAIEKSEITGTPTKIKTEEKAMVTDSETSCLPASVQLHRNFPGTPNNSPSKLKARKASLIGSNKALKLKTEEKEDAKQSIAYWKELAESRRQALDAALQENYELHKRVEELEKENAHLEEIVKEAEKLAIMVNDAAEDDELELDESGIVDTKDEGTAV